jgi:uncharacterized phage-associated protein
MIPIVSIQVVLFLYQKEEIKLTKKEKDLIVSVWKVYGQFSAWRLRDMTHNETPWKSTPRNIVLFPIKK